MIQNFTYIVTLTLLSLKLTQCTAPITPEAQKVRNKLVLIDLPSEDLASFGVSSPFGDRMSIVEVQANLIANLMTDSFLIASGEWFDYTATTLGAVFFSLILTSGIFKNGFKQTATRGFIFCPSRCSISSFAFAIRN